MHASLSTVTKGANFDKVKAQAVSRDTKQPEIPSDPSGSGGQVKSTRGRGVANTKRGRGRQRKAQAVEPRSSKVPALETGKGPVAASPATATPELSRHSSRKRQPAAKATNNEE